MSNKPGTKRSTPLDMSNETFRKLGYRLVDKIARYYDSIESMKLNPDKTPREIRSVLGNESMPEYGNDPEEIIENAIDLLFENSLFDGHPRFWGYIIGCGTPIGSLADLLAAAINPNLGGWELSPMASEIEAQTIRWIAEFIHYPPDCGGLLVSGGAMANYIGFLTARRVKAPAGIREKGLLNSGKRMTTYCSHETHTWIQKATDLFGLGTDSIRWIPSNANMQMDMGILKSSIEKDRKNGYLPFLVIGSAGTVSTGAIDDLNEISKFCQGNNLWFHIDAAYGGPAAGVPEYQHLFSGLEEADSIALDPHKWFYSSLEAGCVLTRKPQHLLDTFSYRPPYYHFDETTEGEQINYYEYGIQNSRGFRALKVWMGFLHAGRKGFEEMIRDDIKLAEQMAALINQTPNMQLYSQNLSICTFRYKPAGLEEGDLLNELNETLMIQIQNEGNAYITNAVINDQFLLRSCIVNFRTTASDIAMLPMIITKLGKSIYADLRQKHDE
jgi:glutamate/tyrosine decarboxylase-like PLP-dependent enzyme